MVLLTLWSTWTESTLLCWRSKSSPGSRQWRDQKILTMTIWWITCKLWMMTAKQSKMRRVLPKKTKKRDGKKSLHLCGTTLSYWCRWFLMARQLRVLNNLLANNNLQISCLRKLQKSRTKYKKQQIGKSFRSWLQTSCKIVKRHLIIKSTGSLHHLCLLL